MGPAVKADADGCGMGAALQVKETPADSFTAGAVEFKVIGTAVRLSALGYLTQGRSAPLSAGLLSVTGGRSSTSDRLMLRRMPSGSTALTARIGIATCLRPHR